MWVSARPRAVWKGAGCKEGGVCETGGCVAGQKEGEGEKIPPAQHYMDMQNKKL